MCLWDKIKEVFYISEKVTKILIPMGLTTYETNDSIILFNGKGEIVFNNMVET